MAKDKPFEERLQDQIRALELQREEEMESFHREVHELREQLSLSNILRNATHHLLEDPSKRKKLLLGVAGIIALALLGKFTGKGVASIGKALLPLIPVITKTQKQS